MLQKAKGFKSVLFVIALGVWLLAGRVMPTHAAGYDDCDKRIHKAEDNLKKEVDRHGEHSPQAEKRRHELEEVRKSCGDHHDEHH